MKFANFIFPESRDSSRDADAIKAFRQTVKLAPESADAWLRLAYLCEKEGKAEEALRAFKEAKRLWSF